MAYKRFIRRDLRLSILSDGYIATSDGVSVTADGVTPSVCVLKKMGNGLKPPGVGGSALGVDSSGEQVFVLWEARR